MRERRLKKYKAMVEAEAYNGKNICAYTYTVLQAKHIKEWLDGIKEKGRKKYTVKVYTIH